MAAALAVPVLLNCKYTFFVSCFSVRSAPALHCLVESDLQSGQHPQQMLLLQKVHLYFATCSTLFPIEIMFHILRFKICAV